MRTIEFGSIFEVVHEPIKPIFRENFCVKSPKSVYTLRGTKAIIGEQIIEKTIFFAPHVPVDIVRKAPNIIFKFFYFLPTL